MQDNGGRDRAEIAAHWLRDHFSGDPAPEIDIQWIVNDGPDPINRARLQELLFGGASQ